MNSILFFYILLKTWQLCGEYMTKLWIIYRRSAPRMQGSMTCDPLLHCYTPGAMFQTVGSQPSRPKPFFSVSVCYSLYLSLAATLYTPTPSTATPSIYPLSLLSPLLPVHIFPSKSPPLNPPLHYSCPCLLQSHIPSRNPIFARVVYFPLNHPTPSLQFY